jgi:hypothetical protein
VCKSLPQFLNAWVLWDVHFSPTHCLDFLLGYLKYASLGTDQILEAGSSPCDMCFLTHTAFNPLPHYMVIYPSQFKFPYQLEMGSYLSGRTSGVCHHIWPDFRTLEPNLWTSFPLGFLVPAGSLTKVATHFMLHIPKHIFPRLGNASRLQLLISFLNSFPLSLDRQFYFSLADIWKIGLKRSELSPLSSRTLLQSFNLGLNLSVTIKCWGFCHWQLV